MKPHGYARVLAAALVALSSTACGIVQVSAFLNLDPNQPNSIAIHLPTSDLTIPLVGGIHASFSLNTQDLISPQGVGLAAAADQVRIAGPSEPFSVFNTGTLCARENPADPTTAMAFIQLLGQSTANFHFAALATSDLIKAIVPAGTVALAADAMGVPLQIDVLGLLHRNMEGTLRTSATITGRLPANIPLLGNTPYTLTTHLESSSQAGQDPLLTACQSFFAG